MRNARRNRPDTAPLRLIGLDRQFSEEELEVLAFNTDVLRLPAGDVLARIGEVPRQFMTIVDGYVEVTAPGRRPYISGPGTRIGATEVISGECHTAKVTTRSEVTLVVIFGPSYRSAVTIAAVAPEGGTPAARASDRVTQMPNAADRIDATASSGPSNSTTALSCRP